MFAKLRSLFTKEINVYNKGTNKARINKINVRNIQMLPMNNNTSITNEIRAAVYSIFEKYKVVNNFPDYEKYFIKVSTSCIKHELLIEAHNIFTEPFFYLTETIPNLPHQKGNPHCPNGLLRVGLECINKYNSNMGSYWGYEGYYLSLLVDIKQLTIWDARGVKTR